MKFFQTIRARIIFLFSILLSITFFIVISFFIYENQKKKLDDTLNLLNKINSNMNKLSAIEKNLLVFEVINPDFYLSNADSSNIEKSDIYNELKKSVDDLSQMFLYANSQNQINELKSLINKYAVTYDSTVYLLRMKGWKDYGLIGEMRNSAHAIENNTCDINKITLLMMRRHEKDFLLRKQNHYVDLLQEKANELKKDITVKCRTKTKRDSLLALVENYQQTFLKIVILDKQIGQTNSSGIKIDLSKLMNEVSEIISKIDNNVVIRANKIRQQTRMLILRIMLIALVLNIFVVLFLVKKLGNPIKKLTNSIIEVVNNNFDKKYTIAKIISNDEIGQLANSFEFMLNGVHQSTELILEKNNQIEKSFEELKRLSKLGRDIASNLEANEIIRKTYHSVKKLINFDFFAIGLLDKENERLVFMNFDKTIENELRSFRNLNDTKSLTVWSYVHQKKIYINDIYAEYHNYLTDLPNDDNEIYRSLIYLPLVYLETKLGVVIVKKREKDFFSRFDYNIMKNLALYISLALQNADVFGQLQQQKEKIEKQGKKIHLQNEQIKSSIQQAHTMQSAFLPTHLQLSKAYNYFLVYRPKDIVSGDFYWHKKYDDTKEKPETLYYAVSDCTGHGVPGALMALIGANLMEQFIVQEQIHPLSKVLEMLDFKVRDVLKQKDTENKDGMDVVLCKIEKTSDTTRKVHFASAKRPLYYFDSKAKEVKTLKGTRRSIGGTAKISKELFVDEILHLHKGDILYLTTDGYVDQNNQDRKRFGTTNFINLLNQIATEDLENQQIIIELAIEKYMQNEEQRDDITILGIQL